jgi:glycosyltransferase involved in cell wall biosynthesis
MEQKKLRIAQIIDRLNIGGAERVLVTIANLLQEHGHEVKVVTTVSPGALAGKLNENIRQVNLGRKWKWNVITMRRLVKEIKDHDIIHVHSFHNLRYVTLAAKIFRLKKPIVYHEHHGARANAEPSATEKIISWGIVFIAVSEKLRSWAIEKLRIPEQKVFVLPNTISKENNVVVQEKSADTKELVIVSNFVPVKNLEFAAELFVLLKDTALYNYRFTIIGQIADELYFKKIKTFIAENNLEEHANILTNVEDVQPLLNNFDLAIHTSTSESGPVVLIEYMSQGLPFLTYNTGEVVEQVKSKIPLAVMNSFEKYEWVNRIETLLNLPYDDLSSKFSNVYDHYFSTEAYYNKLMEIYGKALSNQ